MIEEIPKRACSTSFDFQKYANPADPFSRDRAPICRILWRREEVAKFQRPWQRHPQLAFTVWK
jgi:hypothetical protein